MSQNLSTQQVRDLLTGSSLTLHWWRASKGVAGDQKAELCDSVDAEDKGLSATKKLIAPSFKPWKAVTSLRSRIRTHWEDESFPFILPGVRLVLRQKMPSLRRELAQMMEDLEGITRDLDDSLFEILADGRKRLGRLFDVADYPTTFRDLFSMEFREHSIEPPSYLAHSNAEEYQRQLQASLGDVEAGLKKFEAQVWAELGTLAARITAACTPREDGTMPPVFAATIAGVKPLFDKVASLNFSGTAVLQRALREVKEMLDEVRVEDLRDSKGLREEVKEQVGEVVGRFQQLRAKVQNYVPAPAKQAEEAVA